MRRDVLYLPQPRDGTQRKVYISCIMRQTKPVVEGRAMVNQKSEISTNGKPGEAPVRVWYVKVHEKTHGLRPRTTRKSFEGTFEDVVNHLRMQCLDGRIFSSVEIVGFLPDSTRRMVEEYAQHDDRLPLERQVVRGFDR